MSISERDLLSSTGIRAPSIAWLTPLVFSATAFLSAALLFAIQPMFTKLALPRLGGSPSVWSVAVVFFQTALLAGYAYAHLLTRLLAPASAGLVHLVVLGIAALGLPIGIAAGFETPPQGGLPFWVFGLFASSIGLPFAALSASAPLLQAWFTRSSAEGARNPFVLYAASNLGSFAGLLLYPFLIEPLLSLSDQARIWSGGFAIFAMLLAGVATLVAHVPLRRLDMATEPTEPAPALSRRLAWVALAGIPCGLVIAVTAHISTDVASAPFIWVLPLALYLLTFVAVFREHAWISHDKIARLAPLAVTARIILPFALSQLGLAQASWLAMIALDLIVFGVLTLLCHGELYRLRPGSARLTEYYLFVSVGGAIGGALIGLVAPLVFNGAYEFSILITLALFALPGLFAAGYRAPLREAMPALVATIGVLLLWHVTDRRIPAGYEFVLPSAVALLAAYMATQTKRPARFVALTGLAFALLELHQLGGGQIETARSFFGVHKVVDSADGTHRFLFHGTTIHGVERVRANDGTPLTGRPEPLAYYYEGGPIWEAIDTVRQANGGLERVAVVGLGVGSMACHRRAGEAWTFFEIDPEVIRLAHDRRRFRFMAMCGEPDSVVLGDARLTLARSPARFDLIALDSFTSDAIPIHLLTREALASYLNRLTLRGVIVMHVSNRHMDLAPVIAATAAAEGLTVFYREDDTRTEFLTTYRAPAKVAVLARDKAHLGDLPAHRGWVNLVPDARIAAWSDDYSNVPGAIWRHKFGR